MTWAYRPDLDWDQLPAVTWGDLSFLLIMLLVALGFPLAGRWYRSHIPDHTEEDKPQCRNDRKRTSTRSQPTSGAGSTGARRARGS